MFARRRVRRGLAVAALLAIALLVGAALLNGEIFDTSLQSAVYDAAIGIAPAQLQNQITIVAIDDPTITKFNWPLPRNVYTDTLKALEKLGASVIAFDVGFYDPADTEDDRAFAAAVRDSGNVLLAMQGGGDAIPGDHSERYASVQLPIPVLRDAAAGLAAVNIHPDPDGRMRFTQLLIEGPDGTKYFSLSLLTAAWKLHADLAKTARDGDRFVVPTPLGARVMPIGRRGDMPVYFAAPPAHATTNNPNYPCKSDVEFCVVSMKDVLSGTIPRELIDGRAVIVGAHSASGLPEDYPVPNSAGQKMFGVEIWANAVQSIFTNRYPMLRQSNDASLAQLFVVTLLGMLLVLRWRVLGFLGALILLGVYVIGAYGMFIIQTRGPLGDGPIEVPSIAYVVPAPFWWVLLLGYLLFEEQVTVLRTRDTFGRFVTPAVARTIIEREERGKLALGGERKRVTVLFGDIRGFTGLSQGMPAETLLHHLNRYFDGMVDIVNRYEGTVNKYNGDSIMVLWGAPLEVKDQARKAVQCALEMQNWVVTERDKGGPDVAFGFGINTGSVVAGFLGAKGRMEYTVIGDTANVASRLTSSDIARRDQVAVSAETLSELGGDVDSVFLGAILVKGRTEPVVCHQINRVGTVRSPHPAPPPDVPVGRPAVAGYR